MRQVVTGLFVVLAGCLFVASLHAQNVVPAPGGVARVKLQSLGPAPYGKRNLARIRQLHPLIQPLALAAVQEATARGLHVAIIATPFRSIAQQDKKFKQGVSGVRGGWSYHNFGLAFDIIPVVLKSSKWSRKAIGRRQKVTSGWERLNEKREVAEWQKKLVPIMNAHGFTWGSAKYATHIGIDHAHFQTGLRLRKKAGDQTSVENILKAKIDRKEMFVIDGRKYPRLNAEDLKILGGSRGVNDRLLQLVRF